MTDDRITVTGIQCYGYHGVLAAERELGHRFLVDVALSLDLQRAAVSDDLSDTVDYGLVCRTVRGVVEGEPCRLIETVAERIAAAVLDAYPVEAVVVRVSKPSVPIPDAFFREAAVEITRKR